MLMRPLKITWNNPCELCLLQHATPSSKYQLCHSGVRWNLRLMKSYTRSVKETYASRLLAREASWRSLHTHTLLIVGCIMRGWALSYWNNALRTASTSSRITIKTTWLTYCSAVKLPVMYTKIVCCLKMKPIQAIVHNLRTVWRLTEWIVKWCRLGSHHVHPRLFFLYKQKRLWTILYWKHWYNYKGSSNEKVRSIVTT